MSSRVAAAMTLVLGFHLALRRSIAGYPFKASGAPSAERFRPPTNPGDRSDPFAHVPVGTQTVTSRTAALPR